MKLEICVEDLAGVAAALEGGADRIELCSALALGGVTPSTQLLVAALDLCRPKQVPVHVMVRPRAGDFDYDESDLKLALSEGEALVDAGADGLMFGATRDGGLDLAGLRRWVERFRGQTTRSFSALELSLHRAIDTLDDLVAAVDEAVGLGFGRILSSGGASNAAVGAPTLARMVERAGGRCRIAAGAGIVPGNVRQIIAASRVDEVHSSASTVVGTEARLVSLGFAGETRKITAASLVRALKDETIQGPDVTSCERNTPNLSTRDGSGDESISQ